MREAHIWQARRDCVRYDPELLYVPSQGCAFENREFATTLTFTQQYGRTTGGSQTQGRPVLILGDSVAMGWGVNDNETYAHHLAGSIGVPVHNLGVSSFGTVRELIRGMRSPAFHSSNCIILQYHENDLDENRTFLQQGFLPASTEDKFESLVQSPKISTVEASRFIWHEIKLYFGLVKDDAASDANLFLTVVARFPAYHEKTIFVVSGIGAGREFGEALRGAPNRPGNIIPVHVLTRRGDAYPLDRHHNAVGHQSIASQLVEQLGNHKKWHDCVTGHD
jgi:hypothetical protein